MPLAAGQTLSFYKVLGPLGAGGMGEVYLAQDTRLEREVAIKVLPEELANDDERLRRFEREAKVLASLNHTNIAGIHGIDQVDETCFLAMELVPGEDLEERLKRGALPVDEAIDVCRQIAEGLEVAHEAGVVHRDLKPANVRITPDGVVKLLDFGLAKPMFDAKTDSTTGAKPDSFLITSEGMVLGTPTYMSPEQARGKAVDRRTDIWAFGCVLYECLTGKRAFEGEAFGDLIAAILEHDVELDALPSATPPRVRDLIVRCLVKDPRRRLRDVGEARLTLESPEVDGALTDRATLTGRTARRSAPLLFVAGVAAGIVILLLALRLRGAEPDAVPAQPLTVDLAAPGGMRYAMNPSGVAGLLLSPDGTRVVFGASKESALPRLYLRELATGSERALDGTEGAQYPFWSPDGEHVGFFSADKLRRVSVAGGAPLALADASNGKGGSWSRDGWILYSGDAAVPLGLVRAGGGEARVVTDLTDAPVSYSHRSPRFLPDGRRFVYVARNASGGTSTAPHALVLGSLDGGESRLLGWASSQAELDGDRLLYCVGTSLYASDFDPDAPNLEGTRRLLVDRVALMPGAAFSPFSATRDRLVFHTPVVLPDSLLVRFDADGKRLAYVPVPQTSLGVSLSPDRKRMIASLIDPVTGQGLPWIYDIAQQSWTPLALEGDTEDFFWVSNDAVVYTSGDPDGTTSILRLSLSSLAGPEMLYTSDTKLEINSVARGGRLIAFERPTPETSFDVYLLDLDSGEPPRPVASTPNDDYNGLLSPDGRWLTYMSNHLGVTHSFLQSAAGGGRRQQITTGAGGAASGWHPDGDRIYLLTNDNEMRELRVVADETTITLGESRLLLDAEDEAFRNRSPEGDRRRLLEVFEDGFWFVTQTPTPPEGGMGRLILGR